MYSDNEIIVTGRAVFGTTSGNAVNSFIMKLDSVGNLLWSKQFYKDSMSFDIRYSVFDESGYVYSVGVSLIPSILAETPFILKQDTSGNTIWLRAFDFSSTYMERFSDIFVSNGKLIVTGMANYYQSATGSLLLGQIDTSGTVDYFRYLNTNHTLIGRKIYNYLDKGYIITGEISVDTVPISSFSRCFFVMRVDSLFTPIWNRGFLTNDNATDEATAILTIHENRILIGGQASLSGAVHAFLMNLDSLGNQISTKLYCTNSNFVSVRGIIQTDVNHYILHGYGIVNFVRIDSTGNVIGSKRIWGAGSAVPLSGVTLTNDSGLIVAYAKNLFGILSKSDSLYNFSCEELNYPVCNTPAIVFDTFPFQLVDTTFTYTTYDSLTTVPGNPQYTINCLTATGISILPEAALKAVIMPNPVNDELKIQFETASEVIRIIEVSTPTGTNLFRLQTGENLVRLDVGDFAPGCYLIRVTDEWSSYVLKFIKL